MTTPALLPWSVLRERGWTPDQVAAAVTRGTLVRVARGVYAAPGDLTAEAEHLRLARVLRGRLGAGAALSHDSAALLHGLPLAKVPQRVHATREPPAGGRRTAQLHLHVAPLAGSVTTVAGVRVTTLARTAADLARNHSFTWGVAATDAALRLGATPHDLAGEVLMAKGRTNCQRLRAVVAAADGRAESPAESASRTTMERAGLPTPQLQYAVLNQGVWVARCDFAWPEFGVVGEVDGKSKYSTLLAKGETAADVVMAEKRREERIRQAGWWVCRWGWDEAWDAVRLGALVRGAFEAAGRRPGGG